MSRLELLSAHDALFILRAAIGSPVILNIIRSSSCADHPELDRFDSILKTGLSSIVNCRLSDCAWVQASLPVRSGGLGIRSVALLATSAFLASAASTSRLQSNILGELDLGPDPFVFWTLNRWTELFGVAPPPDTQAFVQRNWDAASVAKGMEFLRSNLSTPHDCARLLAVSAEHGSEWLRAFPIASCGLRMDDEAVRVAVGLRLGCSLCEPHDCPCGTNVDSLGRHGLSCRMSAGRLQRHHVINDIICRALISADVPATREPRGLLRSDGRRHDSVTLIPWSAGRSLAWDATVADTWASTIHIPPQYDSRGGCGGRGCSGVKEQKVRGSFGHAYICSSRNRNSWTDL